MNTSATYKLLKPTKIFFAVLLLLLGVSIQLFGQTTYTWVGANNASWTVSTSWTPTRTTPATNDILRFNTGTTLTITAVPTQTIGNFVMSNNTNITLQAAGGITLTIGNGAGTDLDVPVGSALTIGTNVSVTLATSATANISGILTVNAGCTFNTNGTTVVTTVNGAINNAGTITCATTTKLLFQSGSTYTHVQNGGTIPTATWNAGSLLKVTGITSTIVTLPATIGGNVEWNCPSQTVSGDIYTSIGGGATFTIGGNFTVTSTGTGTVSLFGLSLQILNIGGNYSQTAGNLTVEATGTADVQTINLAGDFSLSGGTFCFSSNTTDIITINIAGNWSHTAGTLTETSTGSGNIIFNGATTQTYTSGGTVSNTINFTVNSGTTLQMGTGASPSTITGGGTFTLASGATLGVTLPTGIVSTVGTASGNIQTTTGRTFTSGANYIYNGTSAQVTGTGLTQNTPANLTINSTNTVSLSAATTISGDLLISQGTLSTSGSNYGLTLGGNFVNSGTFTAGSSPITITGTTTQSIAGFTTTGLVSITKTGGTATLQGNVNGAGLTINGTGGTLNLGTGLTHIFSGTWTRTNGTLNGGSSLLKLGSGFSGTGGTFTASTGTVEWNAGGVQTIAGVTYNNLTLSGSGAKTTTGAGVNAVLSMEGIATTTGTVATYGAAATLQYKGSASQTTGTEFPATFSGTGGVIINNLSGVTLGAARNISSKLTFVNGKLATTPTFLLSVTNTSTIAITGGSTSSYINGPVKWTLPASLASGTTYNFPVGNTTYLPFALVNPITGTGTVTAQVQATTGNSAGSCDATLTAISNSEYWSLTTVGNFTNSSVSIYRQTTITPTYDAVGGSTTLGGVYTTLSGQTGTNGVSNSNSIGTNRFFVFAKGKPTITVTPLTALNDFSYAFGLGPSSQLRFFSVSGVSLTTNITVLPTDTFEISLSSGAAFAPQSLITLNVSNGNVALDTIFVRMKAGLAVNSITPVNKISCLSTGATTQTVTCSGSVVNAAVITVTSALTNFAYNVGSGPSTAQSFTVSGTNMTTSLVITAPTDYEICLTVGGTYSPTLSLAQSGGNVGATTIYVRLKSGLPGGSYNENLVLTSTNAVTKYIACSGNVNSPTITVSTFVLGGFIYNTGSGPSGYQSFTVSGTNLTANLILTAPTNFEICTTSGGTYGSTITLTQTGGTVSTTAIYARLVTALGVAVYGPLNLTAASTAAITQNVALSGQVVAAGAAILSSNTSLNGFVYTYGNGPSIEQSFTVSGTSLAANLIVTPPTAYIEISLTSGTGYVSYPTTLSIAPSSNKVNAVTVYVRLIAGLPTNSYPSQTIVLTSGVATAVNVVCNGVVIIPVPTISATANGSNPYAACDASTVTLTSTSTGITNQFWSGPNGFYSTAQNPSLGGVSAINAGTYTVTGSALSGVNLLTNGSFESGNTGFGSSYGYVAPSLNALGPENLYTITGSGGFPFPSSVHGGSGGGFSDCTAQSGSYEMVINGATSAGVIAWSQSISVIPGADYQFSYYVETVNTNPVTGGSKLPALLQLYVNGVPAGQIYTASETTCAWQQFVYNTNAGSNTVLQLTLINLNTVANGNDFALDNMVFQQVFPISNTVDLTVNPTMPVSVSITASESPIYSGGNVAFTAIPVNGGASPTYQWKVNGANQGTNNASFIYVPAAGDVITCVMTSNYPCPSPANGQATSNSLTAYSRTNFWVGTNSTDWGTTTNWSGNFIPAPGNDVEYATTTNNGGNPAVNDLQLDVNRTIGNLVNGTTNRALIIPSGLGLTVNYSISTNSDPNLIKIKTGTPGVNGSLIFNNPSNLPVNATVEMYSIASWNLGAAVGSKYQWQYFGIPLTSLVANPFFYGAYVRGWHEDGTTISNHWISLSNDSILQPFYGYELVQAAPTTYVFQGTLVNNDFSSGQLAYTSGALYPGQHIFANPYSAAIDITQLTFGSQTEATVYLYNTGTYGAWLSNGGESYIGINPVAGQYYAIPKNLSGFLGVQKQVPSMQAMLVKALSASSNATFDINYSAVVVNNNYMLHAPGVDGISSSDKIGMLIDVKGAHAADRMWIITNPTCTRGFDNGWDGYKMLGSALAPQLFAMEADGNYQVNTVPDMNDTELGFQAGQDLEDTLTFTHQNLEKRYAGVYLVDSVENKTIDITASGTQYAFMAESSPTPVKRFRIVTRPFEKNAPDTDTQVKIFSSQGSIFVQNFSNVDGECMVYDIAGHNIKKVPFVANGVTAITNSLRPGAYIGTAITGSEKVSKRLIVR